MLHRHLLDVVPAAGHSGESAAPGRRTSPRELVWALPDEFARRAVLLDGAPSDFAASNRTALSAGDLVISLAAGRRSAQFRKEAEQEALQPLDTVDPGADFDDAEHKASCSAGSPRGVAGSDLTGHCRARALQLQREQRLREIG